MTSNRFLDVARKRRSQYALGNDLPISQDQVTSLIQEAMRQQHSRGSHVHDRNPLLGRDRFESAGRPRTSIC